jgi:uracil-DNA glycosylase
MERKSPLPPDWGKYLDQEFEKPYMKELTAFLAAEKKAGKVIYPKSQNIFSSFYETPFERVKVVILGQDPYHGEGQAHGLSFSVNKGIKIPPSLNNIYQELKTDLPFIPPKHGCLLEWAHEGVLLLNNVLTVEAGLAGSHQKKGWEIFTQKVIEVLNQRKENLVFILWGSPAQKKTTFVDEKKHRMIKSVHPSPLSSYRGFFGSRPFSKTNDYLKSKKIPEIDWTLHD